MHNVPNPASGRWRFRRHELSRRCSFLAGPQAICEILLLVTSRSSLPSSQLSNARPRKAAIRSRYNLPNPPREPRTRLTEGRRPGMGAARGMTRLDSLKIVAESFRRARLTPQFNSEGPHIYPLLAFLPINRSSHSLLLTQIDHPIFHQTHLQNACYRAPHYQGYGRSQLVRCCFSCVEPKG
jgi:hypothetical protein